MAFHNKIAIFDLDDTLYDGNSHIEWLCYYYNTSFFKSIIFRAIGKVFPLIHDYIIWKLYELVDDYKKTDFSLPFRQPILKLLREKKEEGFFIVVVSNAPTQLLKNAAQILQVDYLRTEVGEKSLIFQNNYQYKELLVCTDNKTDIDLLLLANFAIITCKRKNQRYFEKRLNTQSKKFMLYEDD